MYKLIGEKMIKDKNLCMCVFMFGVRTTHASSIKQRIQNNQACGFPDNNKQEILE